LIFVRGGAVRGLTTATIVFVTTAVGTACGAGLPLIAIAVTAGHFVVVFVYPSLAARLPRSRYLEFGVRVIYQDGQGVLRDLLGESTRLGFSIVRVRIELLAHEFHGLGAVAVEIDVRGQPAVEPLATALDDVAGVLEVTTTDLSSSID
jgi:putative Mg2+ transporter-C (MgtC) family protein